MTGATVRRFGQAGLAAAVVLQWSCTAAQLQGESSSYVVIDALVASSGAAPAEFGGTLASDVLTLVNVQDGTGIRVPAILQDVGRVTIHLALKDPGAAGAPAVPSPANAVTLTRYHVAYTRTDGRNLAGVDVPHAFDEAMTMTVGGGSVASGQFTIVRRSAKDEPPLKNLAGGGGAVVIATIADVTFYGADQAGRAVSVTGRISIDFADWKDPQ